ncbi:hypothetical protein AND_006135 [Anopheles darlingi]|uniref:Peptidase S1 domain-containing protein n=1 Tax=Anopheles darlingi TaxID=43151 RepID=W5JCU9_ANODA|nr:hypothetical protein AND_006135 [Anopheles darlingi]
MFANPGIISSHGQEQWQKQQKDLISPPPQLELITCLANSSTLNVTTKHCDCETYSCKDVLASSSPPPLNQIQSKSKNRAHKSIWRCWRTFHHSLACEPSLANVGLERMTVRIRSGDGQTVDLSVPEQGSMMERAGQIGEPLIKIHTSCRDHCCRKKKFNRSIDPATLENVAASHRPATGSTVKRLSSGVAGRRSLCGSCVPGDTEREWSYSIWFSSSTTLRLHHRTGRRRAKSEKRSNGTTPVLGPGSVKSTKCAQYYQDCFPGATKAHPRVMEWLFGVVSKALSFSSLAKKPEELVVWNDDPPLKGQPMTAGVASGGATRQRITVSSIILPDQFATTFERLENNVALLVLGKPTEANDGRQPLVQATQGLLRAPEGARKLLLLPTPGESWRRRSSPVPGTLWRRKRTQPEPVPICLSSIIEPRPTSRSSPPPKDRCFIVSPRRHREASSQRQQQPADGGPPEPASSTNDGTNYVTTNISIFPATECRPEHRDYLQHDGNLCAGYGAASDRSIDVDYSGAPLICDESVPEAGTDGVPGSTAVRRTIRGLLTWSTDINHAPHLFTNLTTYRGWIERTIEQLGQRPAFSVQRRQQRRPQGPPPPPPAPITVQSDSPSFAARGQPSVVLYG